MTIDNYLTLISIFLVLIGAIFALIQWNSTIRLRRAEFIDKIINIIRFDKEMAETLYTIDYYPFWYDVNFHKNRDFEYKIDKVLSYFDYICYLYSTKNIGNNEFKILKYRISRICMSPSTQAYLWNLYHFSNKFGRECSFTHIINYGIKNKLIKQEFTSNSINLFIKYLNF
jgi:hypothetical protein